MISEGIYVTLGKDQLKEKNYRKQIKDFLIADGEKAIYFWKMALKPKKEFTTVYIVIRNKVRWKATFIGYEENTEVAFLDGRKMKAKVWMMLIDFVKLPNPYEIRKGFQGFRYKN